MRKTLLGFLFVITSIAGFNKAEAQVSVVLYTSPAKQFFIDDLWKSTIINGSTSSVNVCLQFQVRNNSTDNVLTLTTQVVTLTPGANRLNTSEGTGGKWVYGNNEAATVFQATGKLPYGQYTYGISVYTASTNKYLGSSTDELEVRPMLPPELASPHNEEVITIKFPLLSWIPPRPIIGLSIVYALRLVALQPNQTPAEGLLQNPPLVNLNNLPSTYTMYPASSEELRPGVTYAWQVAASYEGYSLGQTEIWTFTVKPPDPPPADDVIYPVAAKVSDGHFYVTKGIVRFAYMNKANDKKLTYVIKRLDKKENLKDLPELAIKSGTNKLQIDLRHNTGLREKEYYDLQITDSKGQVYKLLYYYILQ
jgi:hypothetical protein